MENNIINQLISLNIIDEKTSFYTKTGFLTVFQHQLTVLKRNQKKLNILFADIDRLGWINDLYGKEHGDLLIQDTAKVIKSTLREVDFASRLEDDLFAVVLIDSDEKFANVIKKRIQERVEVCNLTVEKPYKLSLTCELLSLELGMSLDLIISLAKEKLRKQKALKKNYKILLGSDFS